MYGAGDGAALTGFSGGKFWKISRFREPAIPVCNVPRILFDLSRTLLREPIINTHHLGFELDFRWPGLNVEIDGDHHDRARTQRDDRIQDAVLRANGFVVLRFREEHLDRPDEVLRQLAAQQLPRGIAR